MLNVVVAMAPSRWCAPQRQCQSHEHICQKTQSQWNWGISHLLRRFNELTSCPETGKHDAW